MQYRTFGSLNWKPSALGFGAMRLPVLDDDPARINEELASRMIHTAMDAGVNYIDTAWPYHKEQSERFLGRCLAGGMREKVKLATKLPTWWVESADDFDKYLDQQLVRLKTDHVDFYLLHALNRTRWHKVRDLGVLDWAEGAIADGRIGYLGFSFHDKYAVFREILDAYDWTFCQIQYNYMDTEFQAGRKGLQDASARGLAVVVMNRYAEDPSRARHPHLLPPCGIKLRCAARRLIGRFSGFGTTPRCRLCSPECLRCSTYRRTSAVRRSPRPGR